MGDLQNHAHSTVVAKLRPDCPVRFQFWKRASSEKTQRGSNMPPPSHREGRSCRVHAAVSTPEFQRIFIPEWKPDLCPMASL
jgi:hypothetical protein